MEFRMAQEKDYMQIAEMKWQYCEEEDADYNTTNLIGADKNKCLEEFIGFLKEHKEYKVFVASDNDAVISSMMVYVIPKTPNRNKIINIYKRIFGKRRL